MEKKDRLTVVLGIALVIAGVLAFVWFLPVSSEPIYADYTHWSPHPSCSGDCRDEYDGRYGDWEDLSAEMRYEFALMCGCCVYSEEPYPLKGGHAYYNAFGIELYREWEWIS